RRAARRRGCPAPGTRRRARAPPRCRPCRAGTRRRTRRRASRAPGRACGTGRTTPPRSRAGSARCASGRGRSPRTRAPSRRTHGVTRCPGPGPAGSALDLGGEPPPQRPIEVVLRAVLQEPVEVPSIARGLIAVEPERVAPAEEADDGEVARGRGARQLL